MQALLTYSIQPDKMFGESLFYEQFLWKKSLVLFTAAILDDIVPYI